MFDKKYQVTTSRSSRGGHTDLRTYNIGGKAWVYMAVTILFIAFLFVFGQASRYAIDHKYIKAADLRVNSQIGLIRGDNISVLPQAGGIIIPVSGEGTYWLDMDLTTDADLPVNRLSSMTFSFCTLSPDVKKMAAVNKQGIYICDWPGGVFTPLLMSNDQTVIYEEPYWAPDNQSLYISRKNIPVKDNIQDQVVSAEIIQIWLESKEIKKIADGSFPSIPSDQQHLIFTREGHIIKHDLKTGQEEDLGAGEYPVVSPDGKYMACIRQVNNQYQTEGQALSREEIRDVYIVSLKDPNDIKKVTNNFVHQNIRTEDGLSPLPPSDLASNSVYNGFYDYYNPVWGNDSLTLYVARTEYATNQPMTIRKIVLSGNENTGKEMINSWLGARMDHDTEVLTYLNDNIEVIGTEIIPEGNPHSLAITVTGGERNSLFFDVQVQQAVPSQPFFMIRTEHINAYNELEGYKVRRMALKQSAEYFRKDDGIYRLENGQEEKLLDINTQQLSILGFDNALDILIYCFKENGTYKIKAYNIFAFNSEEIDSEIPEKAVLEDIGFSYSGELMSLQYSLNGKKGINIYNIKEQKIVPVPFLKDIKRAYWFGNNMKVYSGNENFTLYWTYNPGLGNRYL
ncbi:MAG: hypothetical protein PHF24_05340 [Syntrophomonas sp.]|nr:hypothetical protein [Syntrophomonas sp.]